MDWSGFFSGALGGATITGISTLIFALKKRKWDLFDLKTKINQEKVESEFKVYNDVLRVDGEAEYIPTDENTGLYNFKLQLYKDNIRPILFKDFHKLTLDIRTLVRDLDDLAASHAYYANMPLLYDEMSGKYIKLILAIEDRYKEYQ